MGRPGVKASRSEEVERGCTRAPFAGNLPVGISISELGAVLHIPYGPPNHDGTLEARFVDLKTHPEWVSIIPASLGWPETRGLLRAINRPESPWMSLAAHQDFTTPDEPGFQMALTSFVTMCYADVERNGKQPLVDLAQCLKRRMSDLLQHASDELERTLFLRVVLELQPTIFHQKNIEGWSLTAFLAAYGSDADDARWTWGIGVRTLQETLSQHEAL